MLVASFTDRELEMLIAAVKYWRTHREPDARRRSDRFLVPHDVEALLAKLGCGQASTLPASDRLADVFRR